MPLKITDFEQLRVYADGVMGRSDHHAHNVGGIALSLLGAVLWRAEGIQVYGNEGGRGNVLWATIGGGRYAFSYDHEDEQILMKDGSTHGSVLHRCDNSTRPQDVEELFRSL